MLVLSRVLGFGLLIAGAIVWSAPANAEEKAGDWSVMLGAGAGVGPKYEGGRKMQFGALPLVDVTWRDRVFLHGLSVGAYAINTERFKLAASVGYGGGRKEKDGPRLAGMGKVKSAIQPSIMASYTIEPLTVSAVVTRDLGGARGTTATLGAELEVPVTERLSLTGGLSATWADGNHMKRYFGVSAEQATTSRNAQYRASSGVKSVEFSVGAHYAITEHWMAMGQVGMTSLLGDARKSPVVERETAVTSMLGVAYRF
jgi:MipA family protein